MASSPTPLVPSGVMESGGPHEQHVDVTHVRVRRHDIVGQRRGHDTAGAVRHGVLQQRHADSAGDAPDDLTAGRLRVEDPAAIHGRDHSRDADRAGVRIDVDLDEVRGPCTGVRVGGRRLRGRVA
jgi:hypothetical protein